MNSASNPEMTNQYTSRRTSAVRASLVFAVAFLGTVGLYFYLAQQTRAWQFNLLMGATAIVSLADIFAVHFSRRGRFGIAAVLLIGGMGLLFPIVTSLLTGVGIVLGIGGMIGSFMASSLMLVQPQLNRGVIAGFVLGIGTILLDTYFPFQRLEVPLVEVYVPVVAVIGIGIMAYFIAREFGNYSLRSKLIISFTAIAIITVSILAFVFNRTNSTRLTKEAGEKLQAQSESSALLVSTILTKEIQSLEAFGLSKVVQDRVEAANASYTGSQAEILNNIQNLDQEWKAADKQKNNNDPLVSKVLGEIISSELREYKSTFPENVEVFVTDRYGANVAATNRTSDYYQGDEEWWQEAYHNGAGAIYLGQPAYDESSATYSSNIAIPLYAHDTKKVIGVLRTTLDLKAITSILSTTAFGATGSTELYLANGMEISNEGAGLIPGDLNALRLPADRASFDQILYKNIPSFVSRVPVTSSDPSYAPVIQSLGMSIVSHQDRQEALQPVLQQTRAITLTSIILILLSGLAALYASQILAMPVQLLTKAAEQIAAGDLTAQANITTQDEIGTLANAFNAMTMRLRDFISNLEQRINERTADLEAARQQSEKRARELQAISEISSTIASEQKLEILLPLITRLVSEEFDFYHVGIFLVDDARRFAVLQAANSEGGRRMLERGHRLEVGQTGIVGHVTQTGQPRITLDVGADAEFFNNPDLPETRSEMALPLIIRGQIIGALDVQSKKASAFTENDANTLGILADQVAIAIENARLFGQTQQALGEVRSLYRQYLSQEWRDVAKQNIKVGYRKTLVGGKLLDKPVESDEIQSALKRGRVQVLHGHNGKNEPTVIVPIKLRGQTIGVINIKSPIKNRQWSQDEINLTQEISDRLAIALDNSRLLQDLQRRAAKEAKISEVTARIGASINMRSVLQTAVEELGRSLPGSEVIIQFNKDT